MAFEVCLLLVWRIKINNNLLRLVGERERDDDDIINTTILLYAEEKADETKSRYHLAATAQLIYFKVTMKRF